MSMLAEPKSRVKYSINPRGLDWVNDEEKFGQKLMEKMGWKKGKGLGANEDGMLEHVRVSLKMDTRGVGCTKKSADNWIAHQDDFASILADMNAANATSDDRADSPSTKEIDPKELLSLENKSKNSKSRVHYHKFTKGKDLSLKGKKDLDCIFGKREKKKQSEEEEDKEVECKTKETGNDSGENSFGVKTVTSSTSLADYFAQKMAALKRSKSEGQLEKLSTEPRSSFEFGERVSFNQELDKGHNNETGGVKWNIGEDTEPAENVERKIKKEKKKKNRAKISESVPEMENDVQLASFSQEMDQGDVDMTSDVNQNGVEEDIKPIENEGKKIKKHKKKRNIAEIDETLPETEYVQCDNKEPEQVSSDENKSKKSKKHKRKRNRSESPEEIACSSSPSKIKKRKSKDDGGETQETVAVELPVETSCKKKKKHKKEKDV